MAVERNPDSLAEGDFRVTIDGFDFSVTHSCTFAELDMGAAQDAIGGAIEMASMKLCRITSILSGIVCDLPSYYERFKPIETEEQAFLDAASALKEAWESFDKNKKG